MGANYEFLFVPVEFDEPSDKELAKFKGKEYDQKTYDLLIGIFQSFASNKRVLIRGREERLYDWLAQQDYDLGIAEFAICAGAFYIFNLLKIPAQISTSAIPPQTSLLNMLDIDASELPDYRSVEPGQTKSYPWRKGTTLYEANRRAYLTTMEFFAEFGRNAFAYYKFAKELRIRKGKDRKGLIGPSSIDRLFQSVKFLLVNQHRLANFKRMPVSPRLHYIGGIHVEEKGTLLQKLLPSGEEKHSSPADCLVLYNMGTVVRLRKSVDWYGIQAMFEAMGTIQQCRFIVRIDPEFEPANYNRGNIRVSNQFFYQQEILARPYTRVFISHCGQNSMLEAMYAGVALICIPFGGDQPYNSSLVEHLRIGVWIPRKEMHLHIHGVLDQLLRPGNYIQKNALELAKRIRSEIDQNRGAALKRNIFLWAIAEAINNGRGDGGGGGRGGGDGDGGGPTSSSSGGGGQFPPVLPPHSPIAGPSSSLAGGGSGSSSPAMFQGGVGKRHQGGIAAQQLFSPPEKSPTHPPGEHNVLPSIWEAMLSSSSKLPHVKNSSIGSSSDE